MYFAEVSLEFIVIRAILNLKANHQMAIHFGISCVRLKYCKNFRNIIIS